MKDAAGRTLGRADEPERVRRAAPPARPSRGDGLDEPLPFVRDADDALVAAPGAAPGASMAAMRELAHAFHANAQALRQAQTVQSELSRALKRGDRADLVLQSTNALNETFRNLVTVQKRLLERLEAPPPPPVGSRLVPLMLVALLVVFLGGVAGVIHVFQAREKQVDPFLVAREMDAAREKGRNEAEAALATRTQQQDLRVEEAEARLAELATKTAERERELEEIRRSKATLESEQSALADEALRLRDEAIVRRAIESELSSANARLAVLEPRLQQLEGELLAVRNERLRLQKRIATDRMGIPEPEDAAAATADGASPETPVAPPVRDLVSRDARQIEAVQAAVNRLLERGLRARGEYWQMARLGGVSADRLHGVVLHRYDARGKLLDGVEGSEVVIHLDRQRGVVEFEVRRGAALFDGVRTPFSGALHRIVDEGPDALAQWAGSGLLMVRTGG